MRRLINLQIYLLLAENYKYESMIFGILEIIQDFSMGYIQFLSICFSATELKVKGIYLGFA